MLTLDRCEPSRNACRLLCQGLVWCCLYGVHGYVETTTMKVPRVLHYAVQFRDEQTHISCQANAARVVASSCVCVTGKLGTEWPPADDGSIDEEGSSEQARLQQPAASDSQANLSAG